MVGILQSGNVTPGHLASWTTDGVIQDAGITLNNTYALFSYSKQGINFNSTNSDNTLLINLPAGYTKYRVEKIIISGATASLSTATCSVWTQASGLGSAVVASGSAITVTQTLDDTNNNMQSLTIANQNTMSLIETTLYFRVQTAQGSAALGNVTILYEPLP